MKFNFFASKPDLYGDYLNLESNLNALIERGQKESEQAEKLRNAMVRLWWKLTPEQKRELNKKIDSPQISRTTPRRGR